jgi:hypothetical protein
MDIDSIIIIILGAGCGFALLGGVVLLVVGTIFKTRFGINLGTARCGECRKAAPTVRAPKTLYEVLWGGWTCPRCGCQNDKWGNPI